jgi:hypothetical protein
MKYKKTSDDMTPGIKNTNKIKPGKKKEYPKGKSIDKKKDSPKDKFKKYVSDEMEEYKEGKLHSGSKKGPIVKDKKVAIAIALNVARRKTKGK